MNTPGAHETDIRDPSNRRIDWLTQDYFSKLADSADGWRTLYRDPHDGRLWELSYPDGELHGGGPPRLAVVDHDYARLNYKVD
jgi:immunity protein 27 of polymorphic toxin system